MKRVIWGITGALLFIALAVGVFTKPAQAQDTSNFTISSFTADYYIGRTDNNVPTMRVEELIIANFPDRDQNHGILRAIPTSYKGQPLDIQIESITSVSGAAYPYSTSGENGNKVLKIGSPDSYVRGTVAYKIIYTLKNEISFYDSHDELYWNVNGVQWDQPFGEVVARVHIPAELAGALQDRQVCYTGAQGSTAQNCTIERSEQDGGVVVTTAAQDLPPRNTLTFVLAFNAGTFAKDAAAQQAKIAKITFFVVMLFGVPLIALFFVIRKWRKYGRDPKGRGTIVPEYLPPKSLNVLTSGVILHEKLRTQDITALIIELAIKKYVAIYEIEKKGVFGKKAPDYELELVQPYTGLAPEEQAILKLLFPSDAVGSRVKLADLKTSLYKEVTQLSKSVPKQLMEAGYFTNNPATARNKYLIAGWILIAVAGMSIFFALGIFWPLAGLAGGLALAGSIILMASRAMPARSEKGVEARDYLKGLEMYMKLAEADRIKYLQSPEGVKQWGDPASPDAKIKLFEKLLPYAMLFGIEKDWAKEFQDIYREPPEWYHGNWSTFNTAVLVGSLNSFGTASGASFAAPSSSSSSGFGGGGFSGGGGGGGGGGGW